MAVKVAKDRELCAAIEAIVLEFAGYGYRRVVKELARRGWNENSKRVLRIMREQGLLCQPKRKFVVTTNSNHSHPVFKNLLKGKELSEPDQVWHADITYVSMPKGFVYLAAILDGYSRKCIGWKLSKRIDTELALGALEMALANRQIKAGLTHHSDRGVQYTSIAYVSRLKEAGIEISMSRKGNPYDNAKAESFMKTLKYEEVYLKEYQTYQEAADNIGEFRVY
jgi:transposase InsO family protein